MNSAQIVAVVLIFIALILIIFAIRKAVQISNHKTHKVKDTFVAQKRRLTFDSDTSKAIFLISKDFNFDILKDYDIQFMYTKSNNKNLKFSITRKSDNKIGGMYVVNIEKNILKAIELGVLVKEVSDWHSPLWLEDENI